MNFVLPHWCGLMAILINKIISTSFKNQGLWCLKGDVPSLHGKKESNFRAVLSREMALMENMDYLLFAWLLMAIRFP